MLIVGVAKIVHENVFESEKPRASVTFTVVDTVCAVFGVPLMTPVVGSMDMSVGKPVAE